MRRSARRDEKRARTRRKRSRTGKIATKSMHRTEEFVRKIPNKVNQGADAKGTRKRTSLGLRLSPKLRKV